MVRTVAQNNQDKRRAILNAATQLFADQGYGRASISEVAAACGISKANVYHYYPSKEALLFVIIETHLKYLLDRICGLTFETDDPAEQLRVIFVEILIAYEGADAEHDVLLSASRALPEEQQEILREYQREFLRFVRARLLKIAPPSVAENKSKMRGLTHSVLGMLNWHYKWNSGADAESRREHANMVTDLVLAGVPHLT